MVTDGSPYTASDGSQFVYACNQDFPGNNLGTNPVQANSLTACVELCASQGTSCAGSTYGNFNGNTPQCYIHSEMLSGGKSVGVVGAVRLHGASGLAGPVNQLVNSGFTNTLAPWQSSNSSANTSFVDTNGVAALSLPLSRETAQAADNAMLFQSFTSQAVGLGWFFQATVSINIPTGSDDICYINVYGDSGDTYYLSPYSSAPGLSETVYGSGTLQDSVGALSVYAQCNGHGDATFAIDNVYFYTFGATQSTSGGSSCTQQVLNNTGFDTQFAPWTTTQGDQNNTFSITNGHALVSFPAGAVGGGTPAYITQSVSLAANTPFTLLATIYVTTSQDGECIATFGNSVDSMYYTGVITDGQIQVNQNGTIDGDATSFYIGASCSGSTANSIAFDNIQLYLTLPSSGSCKRDGTQMGAATNSLSTATEVLVNNLFSNQSFAHWNTNCPSNRATFSEGTNAALVTFGNISPTLDSPSYITQNVSTSVGVNTTLITDVSVTVLGGGDSCSVSISTADELWAQIGITSSQSWHVNVNHTIVQAGTQFSMYATCKGSSLATVSFGNVYFTLNAY